MFVTYKSIDVSTGRIIMCNSTDHEHCGHHHSHDHSHSYATASSPEEALALLKYMLNHNTHHAEELHDLAHSFDDESVADLLHDAVDKLGESNSLIEQALSLIEH